MSKKARNSIIYSLVISGSFYFGIIFYGQLSQSNQQKIQYANLKIFGPEIEKALQKDFNIKIEEKSLTVKNSEIKTWSEAYIRRYTGNKDIRLSETKIVEYLESIADNLNVDPVNAKLNFSGGRAQVFIPHTVGRKINFPLSASLIESAILDGNSSASLAFDTLEPEVTLEKINTLGIETLLGRGESDYGKSSSARIHNIKIGMSKFNGVILKPGEEFSFNKILGEVDDKAGYQAELVIKSGELVREFGGGLCQVATTVFRGAIYAGLDITERKPHSFPVQYYNPQGFDATIYPGVVDLKFINNTKAHILIQSKLSGGRLTVEIYGSDEDKKVTVEGPVQYDKQPNGAMKAYFVRKIALSDGTSLEEERFSSIYKPPPLHPEERNPLE
jgi:vancomycin resistance protein YoaR